MTNLDLAKAKYTPGTVFVSPSSGSTGIIPENPVFEREPDNDIYAKVNGDFGPTEMYVFFKGDWAEIKEPFHGIPDHIVTKEDFVEGGEKLIRRFETGAVRSDATGRSRPDWVSPYAVEAISMRMVGAQNDFGEANYLKGIPELKCLESLCRHVEELKEALLIEEDPKKAKDLAAAVGFNVTAMLHTMVLKEKGLYKKIYDDEEVLITVSEAKEAHTFTEKK